MSNKKILVIDDAAFMRTLLKNILLKNGYDQVSEAETGKDGINTYKSLKPGAVIIDTTIPDMETDAVIREIKDYDPDAAIIVCAGPGQQMLVMKAIHAGAKDFLNKPFDQDHLFQVIKKVLG